MTVVGLIKNKHIEKLADDKHCCCFFCFGHEIYYMMPMLNYLHCDYHDISHIPLNNGQKTFADVNFVSHGTYKRDGKCPQSVV